MKDKLKKYLLPNLPYLFFVYLFDKLCQAVRLVPGLDASEKLLHIGQGFQTAFASSAPSFHALDICIGILGAILVRLAVYVKGKNAKKYRKGIWQQHELRPDGVPLSGSFRSGEGQAGGIPPDLLWQGERMRCCHYFAGRGQPGGRGALEDHTGV